MAGRTTKMTALLRLARRGPFRARALEAAGIPRAYLARLLQRGELQRIDRGLYVVPDVDPDELEVAAMAAALARVPRATLCLRTAAYLYGLTRRAPDSVWLMIGTHDRRPSIVEPRTECVRAKGRARTHGIERAMTRFGPLRLTSEAKTVADCFRYRQRVGEDFAKGLLRTFIRQSRQRGEESAAVEALLRAAQADRVVSIVLGHLPSRLNRIASELL